LIRRRTRHQERCRACSRARLVHRGWRRAGRFRRRDPLHV